MESDGRRDFGALAEVVEEIMDFPSWRDFVAIASKEPMLRRQFTAETGFSPPKPLDDGFERTIDMSGVLAEHSRLFTLWVTKTHYRGGVIPPEVRAAVSGVEPSGGAS